MRHVLRELEREDARHDLVATLIEQLPDDPIEAEVILERLCASTLFGIGSDRPKFYRAVEARATKMAALDRAGQL